MCTSGAVAGPGLPARLLPHGARRPQARERAHGGQRERRALRLWLQVRRCAPLSESGCELLLRWSGCRCAVRLRLRVRRGPRASGCGWGPSLEWAVVTLDGLLDWLGWLQRLFCCLLTYSFWHYAAGCSAGFVRHQGFKVILSWRIALYAARCWALLRGSLTAATARRPSSRRR
jgi:hypothetical protein